MAIKKNTIASTDVKENPVEKTEEATKTTDSAAGTEKAATKAEAVKLIYIGPTLPKAALKKNSIFDGTEKEIKAHLQPVIEKFPLVEKMLVPVSELAEKKDKVRTAGNVLNKYYSDIVSAASASIEKED